LVISFSFEHHSSLKVGPRASPKRPQTALSCDEKANVIAKLAAMRPTALFVRQTEQGSAPPHSTAACFSCRFVAALANWWPQLGASGSNELLKVASEERLVPARVNYITAARLHDAAPLIACRASAVNVIDQDPFTFDSSSDKRNSVSTMSPSRFIDQDVLETLRTAAYRPD
jgi:hypothetical protein